MTKRWVGIDAGGSGLKAVLRGPDGIIESRRFAAGQADELERWIARVDAAGIGTTGAGGAAWAKRLGATGLPEFQAWVDGAGRIAAESALALEPSYLVVSVGTGTSAILAGSEPAERAGGCALGGGTLLGLGRLLLGTADHDEIVGLAAEGDRRGVDLEIAELYAEMPPGFTASNFGGVDTLAGSARSRADLARALVVMIGENVSILCCALAASRGVRQIVFGGGTLRGNSACWEIIEQMAGVRGLEALRLAHGEFPGAVGAALAAERAG